MTPEESKALGKLRASQRATTKAAAVNQLDNTPPQVYRVPRINRVRDVDELTLLVQAELTKIEQAQSVILSLYAAFNPKGRGGGVDITPDPIRAPGTYVEIGRSNDDLGFMDFHVQNEPMGADYAARIRWDSSATAGEKDFGTITISGWRVKLAGGAGGAQVTSTFICNDEIQTNHANSYRHVYGNYGAFWRQDGVRWYLMVTDSGDQYGSYNDFRPFWADMTTGKCVIQGSISAFERLETYDGAQYMTDRMADTREALLRQEIKEEIFRELAAMGVIPSVNPL